MPTQSLGTASTRRQLLGVAALGSSTFLLPGVGLAQAAPVAATPQGDDVAFLSFGAVAEGVLTRFYTEAQRVRGAFTRAEKRRLAAAHAAQVDHVARLNAALGPDDAVAPDAFERVISLGTRAGALKVGRRLEATVAGVYLTGVGAAVDPGTRLLLGRLLASASAQRAELSQMAGRPTDGLPVPVELDAAGRLIDSHLRDPTS